MKLMFINAIENSFYVKKAFAEADFKLTWTSSSAPAFCNRNWKAAARETRQLENCR
jgi:hypothetical protein